jgi:hypothetical protein
MSQQQRQRRHLSWQSPISTELGINHYRLLGWHRCDEHIGKYIVISEYFTRLKSRYRNTLSMDLVTAIKTKGRALHQ